MTKKNRSKPEETNPNNYPPGEQPIVSDEVLRKIRADPKSFPNAAYILTKRAAQAEEKKGWLRNSERPDKEARLASAEATIELVSIFEFVGSAIKNSSSQSKRAKKPRVKVGDDGERLIEIVQTLKAKHGDSSAKELWRHFHSELDERCLHPREVDNSADYRKCYIEFDSISGARRRMTFGRFQNALRNKSR